LGIRELILWPIVLTLSVVALVRPRVGLYTYIWWGLMRPDILSFAEGKVAVSLILAAITAASSLPYAGNVIVLWKNPISRLLLLLQIPVGLSVVFSLNPSLCLDRYGYYIRMIIVLLLIPVLIQTEQHMKQLLLVMAFSLGMISAKFGLSGVIHGGVELAGGYGEMLADNNFVALAFAMLLPLAWYARQLVKATWAKCALFGIALLCIPAIVMSNSRGSILALTAGLICIVLFTKRKVLSLILLVAVAGGAIHLVQDMFTERMSTLAHPTDEASANSRIVLAGVALQIFQEHPFLGIGFGGLNFAVAEQRITGDVRQHVAHNTYLQVLVDSGIFALFLYVALLGYTIFGLERSAHLWGPIAPERAAIARSIQIPLIVFAVGAVFYSCERMDWPFMLILSGAAWLSISRRTSEELQTNFGSEVALDAGTTVARIEG